MEGGDQWSPLATQCHILGAKIADHVDTGFDCQSGTIADLQGKSQLGAVTDGLAVGADGLDLIWMMAGFGQQGAYGASKMHGDNLVHFAHAIDFIRTWVTQGMQTISDLDGPGLRMAGQQLWTLAMKTDQDGIDTIHAGSGHQADIQLTHGADS